MSGRSKCLTGYSTDSMASSQAASGTSITSFGSGCGTSNIELVPPAWYIALKPGENNKLADKTQTIPFINQ